MGKTVIFPVGDSPAVMFAAGFLEKAGVCVREDGATHILLNVPAKEVDFSAIPENRKIIGGNLDWLPEAVYRMDLLKEERYVAENAALTADCAIRVLGSHLKTAFRDCRPGAGYGVGIQGNFHGKYPNRALPGNF